MKVQGHFLYENQSQFLTPKMMQLMFHEKNAKNAKVYVARLVRATRTCMSV